MLQLYVAAAAPRRGKLKLEEQLEPSAIDDHMHGVGACSRPQLQPVLLIKSN